MPIFIDARIPVVFAPAATAGSGDAVLIEGDGAAPEEWRWRGFPSPCPATSRVAPAVRRAPGGGGVAWLFLAVPTARRLFFSASWWRRPEGEAAVRQALAGDAFLPGVTGW